MVKRKYFNLAKEIEVKSFEELKKPMGWNRLTKENITHKEKVLTSKEKKKLLKELGGRK